MLMLMVVKNIFHLTFEEISSTHLFYKHQVYKHPEPQISGFYVMAISILLHKKLRLISIFLMLIKIPEKSQDVQEFHCRTFPLIFFLGLRTRQSSNRIL